MFDPDGQDLLLLQPGKDPVQHTGLAPAVHPRVDGMPVAKMSGQPPPFATVLRHIQQRVEQLQIGHAHIAALLRQTISDALKLTLCDLHARQQYLKRPHCQLVLTGPRADGQETTRLPSRFSFLRVHLRTARSRRNSSSSAMASGAGVRATSEKPWTASSATTPTRCAESDNVYVKFSGADALST